MTRYLPSKQYQYAGVAALVLAVVSVALALQWSLVWIPAALFFATAVVMLALGFLPAIEIHETHLAIGRRIVAWDEIRRLDRTGFISPLVMSITLDNKRRLLVIYPGGLEASNMLMRHLRRMAREALIDGIPYRQFWGEAISQNTEHRLASPKYQLLLPQDEAEVERLFQRLKTVGHLDRSEDK